MSIILNGQKFEIPGVKTTSWLDPEASELKLKEVTHKSKRTAWIRGIVCHTIHGVLGNLLPGTGPSSDIAIKNAWYQTSTKRTVSWDFISDLDASWLIQNDPVGQFTWHAGYVNPHTVGFELAQYKNGDLFEQQIANTVLLIDFLTAKLGIQRQIPWNKKKDTTRFGQIARISDPAQAGRDVVGIYSHNNQTSNRGKGDPGPWIFNALKAAGYMLFDLDNLEDKVFWAAKQKDLGFETKDCDGIPGRKTVAALKVAGYKHGMLVSRPMDDLIVSAT